MIPNIIWQRETQNSLVQIITTPNWKSGIPINPKIPKYLIRVFDKIIDTEPYVPTDLEFQLLSHQWRGKDLENLVEALRIKEKHNLANLKNPEPRKIERLLNVKAKGIKSKMQHNTH